MRLPAALRLTASSLAVGAGVLLPASASAFPSSRLVYSRDHGAEQCPTEEVVRREVASRLGYDPFFPSADRVIIAEVTPAPKGFRATVHLVDKAGMAADPRGGVIVIREGPPKARPSAKRCNGFGKKWAR